MKPMFAFLLLVSFCFGQAPQGTGRVQTREDGSKAYFSTSGRWLGKSEPNAFGGASYSDGRGAYSKTSKVGNSERQVYVRTPLVKPTEKTLTQPRGHTIMSRPGSSTTGVGTSSVRKK